MDTLSFGLTCNTLLLNLPRTGPPTFLKDWSAGQRSGTSSRSTCVPRYRPRLDSSTDPSLLCHLQYRLAHCNPFPYPLLDALAAYHHLLVDKDIPPERIIIIGDSAGGHLALTLVRYLRDEGPAHGLPMPGGLIVISPWCDVTFSVMGEPGTSGTTNRSSDIINDSLPPYSVSLYCRAIPLSYLSSPYLSPCALHLPYEVSGRGSFEDFPKTFVIAGEAERLRDEVRELVARMKMCEGAVIGYEETYGVSRTPFFPDRHPSRCADPQLLFLTGDTRLPHLPVPDCRDEVGFSRSLKVHRHPLCPSFTRSRSNNTHPASTLASAPARRDS